MLVLMSKRVPKIDLAIDKFNSLESFFKQSYDQVSSRGKIF